VPWRQSHCSSRFRHTPHDKFGALAAVTVNHASDTHPTTSIRCPGGSHCSSRFRHTPHDRYGALAAVTVRHASDTHPTTSSVPGSSHCYASDLQLPKESSCSCIICPTSEVLFLMYNRYLLVRHQTLTLESIRSSQLYGIVKFIIPVDVL